MTRPHCLATDSCAARKPDRHCVRCTAAIPEVRQRRADGARRGGNDPAERQRRSEQATARYADPAERERMSAIKRAAMQDPEKRARVVAGVRRMVQTRRTYRGHAAGLNAQERELYHALLRGQKIPAAEARRLVEEQSRRTVARIAAEMQERESRRVRDAY